MAKPPSAQRTELVLSELLLLVSPLESIARIRVGIETSDPSAVRQEFSFGPERKARAMVDQTRLFLDEQSPTKGKSKGNRLC